MSEFGKFLEWCDMSYSKSKHCDCGDLCTNLNYCKGLHSNCYECIQRVHSYRNKTVHYNCRAMMYYYVLKHGYRFAWEVYTLFKERQKDIDVFDNIWITSIGCGPCTELFGSFAMWRSLGKNDNAYHFRGFDLQAEWSPIMNAIPRFVTNVDLKIQNLDVFEYYKNHNERVDVFVFNYMLSDMYKFHASQYREFLFLLCVLIKEKQPKLIMINDIYLSDSLSASNKLIDYIKNSGFNIQFGRRQYHPLKENIGKFGTYVGPKSFTVPNNDLKQKYDPFSIMKSIQTVIRFQ